MNKDFYEILEINKYATKEEIKKNYKRLALKYHPDKNQDSEESKKKFQDITEAYSVLSDEDKKKRYDKFGLEDNDVCFDEDPFKMFNSIFKEHLHQFQNMKYENNFDLNEIINGLSGVNMGNIFDIPKVHVQFQAFNNPQSETLFQSNSQSHFETQTNSQTHFSHILNELSGLNSLFGMKANEYENKYENKHENKEKSKDKLEEIIDNIVIHVDVSMNEIYNKIKVQTLHLHREQIFCMD